MSKGRAQRRHDTEKKKKRSKVILKQMTSGTDADWLNSRRIGKFTESHWGCQCEICANPRRLWKGKKISSLSLKEYHKIDEIAEYLTEEAT